MIIGDSLERNPELGLREMQSRLNLNSSRLTRLESGHSET